MEKTQEFVARHLGPSTSEIQTMLGTLGFKNLDDLTAAALPGIIRTKERLHIGEGFTEKALLRKIRAMSRQNKIFKSYIGQGYYGTITPTVIQRNILENPGWYTAYTPYQAEISQGRMEALLNFQTMIMELTGFAVANASLLDEATAAAEAMTMAFNLQSPKNPSHKIFVDQHTFAQTIDVLKTRATPLNIEVQVGKFGDFKSSDKIFAAIVQYPNSVGAIEDYKKFVTDVHAAGGLVIFVCDIMALTMLTPPKELGADIAVGTTQRFGVPMGFGGPHAAYIASSEDFKRLIPGRFIGVSKDAHGKNALRLALQTREQHIRRERATSNICTAQVLLAVMASMYAVYHGPHGLKRIATRIARTTGLLKSELENLGFKVKNQTFFDTLTVETHSINEIISETQKNDINLGLAVNGGGNSSGNSFSISIDETVTIEDVNLLLKALTKGKTRAFAEADLEKAALGIPKNFLRTSEFLKQKVFNRFQSETEMLRYIRRLEAKDLSLTTSMIPLGSCTMKLNASSEMYPITWGEFCHLHPFAPLDQAQGYMQLFTELEKWLADITGFHSTSLQPNAGSQGEYAGLLVIRAYHESRRENHRNICLIPASAHGTNPASAVMAGLKVVVVACDSNGNVDLADLKKKAEEHSKNLAALMITYPSTHGVFEEGIVDICKTIHSYGGQVYMDGANMNALVGLSRPAELGADVVHINLHKTFCIPHGGGGPGMGPICVAKHLAEFLPGHSVVKSLNRGKSIGAVSAAPWGSAGILPISWAYIQMMGDAGLKIATQVAILNANYVAKKLSTYFPVLYKGAGGCVAHECILDLRPIKADTGISVDDVAKRLMDYGFHAPTMSFPVAGTLMIEPTESESLYELDRFCDAMISIYNEIQEVAQGKVDKANNPLVNAPHTAPVVMSDKWDRPYSREKAAFPKPWLLEHKYWPTVSRVDNAYGDKNFICSCEPIESYQ